MRNFKKRINWALFCALGLSVTLPSYAYGFGPIPQDFCAECLAISTSNPATNGTTNDPQSVADIAGYNDPSLIKSSLADLMLYMDTYPKGLPGRPDAAVVAHFDGLKAEVAANPDPFKTYGALTSTQWAGMSIGMGGFGMPAGLGERPERPKLINLLETPVDTSITTANYQNGRFVRNPFTGEEIAPPQPILQ